MYSVPDERVTSNKIKSPTVKSLFSGLIKSNQIVSPSGFVVYIMDDFTG